LPVHNILIGVISKAVEFAGPIVIREVSKPRTRRFIEEKVSDVALEFARRRFTGKAKKSFTMKRGGSRFECRRVG